MVNPKFWDMLLAVQLALIERFIKSVYIHETTGKTRGKLPNLICYN